jgi:hypothetical protein
MGDVRGCRANWRGRSLEGRRYLDAIREVERRIQHAERQTHDSPHARPRAAVNVPASWEEHVKLMFDLLVLAYRADITRDRHVPARARSQHRTYPQIGVPEPHHPSRTTATIRRLLAKLAKINAYHVSLFGYFLEQMKCDAGRRRLVARPFDDPAGQRHG